MASNIMVNKPRLIIAAVAAIFILGVVYTSMGGEQDVAIKKTHAKEHHSNEIPKRKDQGRPLKAVGTVPPPKKAAPIVEAAKVVDGLPAEFNVRITTTKGEMVFHSEVDWAPNGVKQWFDLVAAGFFTNKGDGGIGIFRNVPNFVSQFGIHGTPETQQIWQRHAIKDDPVKKSNEKGTLTFAAAGKDTRTTQLYFNLGNNKFLDKMAFAPIAQCVEGCEVMDKFEMKYKEQPNQGALQQRGNHYLKDEFPGLDYILKAVIEQV